MLKAGIISGRENTENINFVDFNVFGFLASTSYDSIFVVFLRLLKYLFIHRLATVDK